MSVTAHSRFSFLLRTVGVLALTVPSPGQSTAAPKPAGVPSGSTVDQAAGIVATPPHPLSAKELREAQIAADTEKLYELAQQLKVELDKSTKDTLSLTVVRKAAEIEKLAHTISDRMKSN